MIIVRSPLRISLFGGGTDHPAWFNRPEPGAVLSTSIDKYVYVQLRHLPGVFDFNYRIAWGMLEEVKEIGEIRHPVVRALLENYASHDTGYEIIYNADLPSRSGLGSSSAFTVSLLHAFFGNQGRMCSKPYLAKEAIHVEQNLLHETVGCQDQIASAYGGFNRIDFSPGGNFRVTPVCLSRDRQSALEDNMMLFFTGFTRSAEAIEQQKVRTFDSHAADLRAIYGMVGDAQAILTDDQHDIDEVGGLLHQTWLRKRGLGAFVSNTEIDSIYERARRAGAIGGKLLGAGGGGFLLLYVPRASQPAVKAALRPYHYVPARMERTGTSVVLYDPELTLNNSTAVARVS